MKNKNEEKKKWGQEKLSKGEGSTTWNEMEQTNNLRWHFLTKLSL